MARLRSMPSVQLPTDTLAEYGKLWEAAAQKMRTGTPAEQKAAITKERKAIGEKVGLVCDQAVGKALAEMLGGIPTVHPRSATLLPPQADCVEIGPTRIIGGIRPQNFDVAYRPDGVRFVYDNKTLNSRESLGKNYQNMLNDLSTEAATVHTRFPSALVAFIMAVPEPCLTTHRDNLTSALMRLSGRISASGDMHKAEVIALVLWHPKDGSIDVNWPPEGSRLRIDNFSHQVAACYLERYAGMPPHNVGETKDDNDDDE